MDVEKRKKSNGKKILSIFAVIALIVVTIGGAYALWTYTNTLGNQTLIGGDVYMKFTEGDTVNMKEAMPSVTYNPEEYFEFSIEGKNKYSKDVVFEILLDEGDQPTGDGNESRTERIKANLLKFRLVEVKEGQEEELIQAGSYDSIKKKRIWVDRVPAGTKEEIQYKYRLYMWISNDVKIGDAETDDYTAKVWNNNVYASVKVAVNGDFEEKKLTEDYMILNAQDTEGEKYDLFQPTGATKDIVVTLGSKREVTKFVVSKSEQYPIALMSLPDETDYPAEYNPTTRAWEAKVTVEETGIYDYYAVYDEEGTNSKTYSFTVIMSPDRYAKIEKPTSALCKAGLTYTGDAQDLIDESNLDQTGYTIVQKQGTDADTYQVTAKLKKEYAWSDATRTDATFECEIAKKDTVLTYEPTSEFKVNKGANKTLEISATTEGEFTVTSQAEGTATTTPKTSSGSNTTITINGVEIGSTKLDIKFVPTNKNYTEKEETYDVEVAKAAGAAKLKETLGQTGGIIGVTTSNTKTTDKGASNIREYRYSGLGAKNYVKFNNELWRILGIFKDESGTEHMKIVRDETLSGIPSSYTANGKTFNLNGGTTSRWDTNSGYDNNWADAGLMNWLNSTGTENGYLKTLTSTAQGMIEETKWYLGTVTYYDDPVDNDADGDSYGIKETPVEAYKIERAITGCTDNKGSSANSSQSAVEGNSTCRVWANNAATWTGKIALMYPSDYGFSTDSEYWNTTMRKQYFDKGPQNTSWLQMEANHSSYEWFLSPSSFSASSVAIWHTTGYVSYISTYGNYGVRPSLNLKSNISVTSGTGEKATPYELG